MPRLLGGALVVLSSSGCPPSPWRRFAWVLLQRTQHLRPSKSQFARDRPTAHEPHRVAPHATALKSVVVGLLDGVMRRSERKCAGVVGRRQVSLCSFPPAEHSCGAPALTRASTVSHGSEGKPKSCSGSHVMCPGNLSGASSLCACSLPANSVSRCDARWTSRVSHWCGVLASARSTDSSAAGRRDGACAARRPQAYHARNCAHRHLQAPPYSGCAECMRHALLYRADGGFWQSL